MSEIRLCEYDAVPFCDACTPPCVHLVLCPACAEDPGCSECHQDAAEDHAYDVVRDGGA